MHVGKIGQNELKGLISTLANIRAEVIASVYLTALNLSCLQIIFPS
jgi:hypothetical protein